MKSKYKQFSKTYSTICKVKTEKIKPIKGQNLQIHISLASVKYTKFKQYCNDTYQFSHSLRSPKPK